MRPAPYWLFVVASAAVAASCGGSSIQLGNRPDGGDAAAIQDGASSGDATGQVDAPGASDGPSCTDGYRDGAETDIDCGGGTCQTCDDGFHCLLDGDCTSGHCSSQQCVPAPCVNGVRDGTETDVDCGGGTCAPCEEGEACQDGPDCLSGVCTGLACAPPACDDTVANGQETDVDCGGPVCPKCADGLACAAPTDCVSANCVGLVCVPCTNDTTFSWEAPNGNEDGTCLTDLGGYRLYYGATSGFYTEVHLVDLTSTACVDSGTTNTCGAIMTCTYHVFDLPAGTWFFAMTAYNLSGVESTYSNEVSKTIACD